MQCSRMQLTERRYKPPPRVSLCEDRTPVNRPCLQKYLPGEFSSHSSSRSLRSTSPGTSTGGSDQTSPELQKTPLIIVNLNIAPEAKTLAPKNVKRPMKKLPPFCVQLQNSLTKQSAIHDDENMKAINDFIVQGTLIANREGKDHKSGHDIIINCDEEDCEDCNELDMCESDLTMNVFNNINTDLLLSLECFEMDSFGRLPGDSRTPTPVGIQSITHQVKINPAIAPSSSSLLVPPGYRPICLRSSSPHARQVIRVDVVNRDASTFKTTESKIKDITYNVNRLREKRGGRNKQKPTPIT
ncbi:unnamed protein product [Diamesa serratosioi]